MRICVLQPSYEGSSFDYRHYDPPRDLSHLMPEHDFHHEFLNKVSTFSQIKALQRQGFDVFVNLCEGYRDSDVPSIDVIHALEDLNLPFTGPTSRLYDPSKDVMKLVARSRRASACRRGTSPARTRSRCRPPQDCGSRSSSSRPRTATAWASTSTRWSRRPESWRTRSRRSCRSSAACWSRNTSTAGSSRCSCWPALTLRGTPAALRPIEFLFPPGPHFKTYDLKVRQFHPECNVPCAEPGLADALKTAAVQVFNGFTGEGYARMDFRVDAARTDLLPRSQLHLLGVLPGGVSGFRGLHPRLRRDRPGRIPARHHRRRIGPARATAAALRGQAQPRRLRHVRRPRPPLRLRRLRRRRAAAADRHAVPRRADVVCRGPRRLLPLRLPISPDMFVLWDTEPTGWAPQNHSCDPNTEFVGLNLVATRDIRGGEELTVDYATFYDSHMSPFDCACGSPNCRRRVFGGGRGLFGE